MSIRKDDLVIGFQGIYYFLTGWWAILHVESFEYVVGPKPDKFQLYTTSLLIIVISIVLLSALRREKSAQTLLLAYLAAFAFIIMEIVYWNQLRWVFYIDFAIQAAIIIGIYLSTKNKKEK